VKTYLYIAAFAAAVLVLAIGGWITRPSTIFRPRYT
jgi:hypothetical protein